MTALATSSDAPFSGASPMQSPTKRPLIDPRMQEAIDQVTTVHEELEIAIAWADKPCNDGNPIVFGRVVRELERLLAAALKNLEPKPVDTLPEIIADHRIKGKQEARRAANEQLMIALPVQSRPAFANQAGAR
jgi:hypothetical protein